MLPVSSFLEQAKLRLRRVDGCSRPAENQFQRISYCASSCRSQYHLYCQRKSPMQRFHCLSGSCPLFILLPVPIMTWGEKGWRRAKGQMSLVPVCAVHRCLHGCTCRHACMCTFVCRTESDCVLLNHFSHYFEKQLCLFIGNYKYECNVFNHIYPKVSSLPPLRTFLHPLLNSMSSL